MKAPYWFPLFNHMEEEHGKTLTDSELNEIAIKVDECRKAEITDTDRLNWLLGFIGLANVYDHDDAPPYGPCVNDYRLTSALENPALFDAIKSEILDVDVATLEIPGNIEKLRKRCLLKGIDHAIREERKNEN
ncbi:MAG: hypothetical protein KC587_17010 [Nitrospira sp.]|nr:hypothetical protein [Nitrospira sp.]